jgi:SAM-dependent methyltransferase
VTDQEASPVTDQEASIRDGVRRAWASRARGYAERAAPSTALFARRLVGMIQPQPGERVLDVATGPGVVALAAAELVGPAGRVLATDLVPEWAAVVAERAAAAGLANVTFRAMSADALELPDGGFDVALCQFGLMLVPDPVKALREMHRVLRAGGRLGVVVWGTIDRVPYFGVVDRHLAPHLTPPVPGSPAARLPSPTSLGAPGLIERHAAAAGFTDVRAERHAVDVSVTSSDAVWRDRVEEGPPHLREAVGRLCPDVRRRLHDETVADLDQYRRGDRLVLPSEAVYLTATRARAVDPVDR